MGWILEAVKYCIRTTGTQGYISRTAKGLKIRCLNLKCTNDQSAQIIFKTANCEAKRRCRKMSTIKKCIMYKKGQPNKFSQCRPIEEVAVRKRLICAYRKRLRSGHHWLLLLKIFQIFTFIDFGHKWIDRPDKKIWKNPIFKVNSTIIRVDASWIA